MTMTSSSLPPHAKRVFTGVVFDVWQWEQEMFDGTTQTFEKAKRPDTASIIPVVGDKIMILEQEQPGQKPYLCFPGGQCNPDEDPADAAKRELLEETGYTSDEWSFLREEHPSNRMIWTLHTYVARNCRQVAEQTLDPGEKISITWVTFDEMLLLSEHPRFNEKHLIPYLYYCRVNAEARDQLHTLLFQ